MIFIEKLHHLDQDITLFLNSLHCSASDSFMVFMSNKEVWFPLYLMTAIALFSRLGWKKALIAFFSIILTITACDQFSNLIKDGVGRLRPCYSTYMLEEGLRMLESRWDYFGFFSAHAANSFGFAVSSSILLKLDKKRDYKFYTASIMIWAFFVAISRIFVGKHYFGDVVVGIIIGILFGSALAWAGKLIIKKAQLNS